MTPDESRARRTRVTLALALIAGVWVFGLLFAPFTGTEARRAVISREMLESGDWVVPTHGGEPALTKPPLHNQLQGVAMAVLGASREASRLPSLLLMALLGAGFVLAARSFGRPGHRYAVAGLLLFASHPTVGKFAISGEIDGPMAVWVGLSLFALAHASLAARPSTWVALSGICAGLAMLTKGPPGLLFLLPAWIPVVRRIGARGLALWTVLLLAPIGAWLGLLWSAGLWDQLRQVGAEETVGRLSFWTLDRIASIPADLAKVAVLLLPPLLVLLLRSRADPLDDGRRRAQRVLLFGAIGGILALCLFPHRSTRYFFPGIPPLLFCLVHGVGPWLDRVPARVEAWKHAVVVLCVIAVPCVAFLLPPWVVAVLAAVLVAAVAFALRGLVPTFVGVGLAVQLVMAGDATRRRNLPPRDATEAARIVEGITKDAAVMAWGYTPSELIWQLGGRLRSDQYMREKSVSTPWLVVYDPDGWARPNDDWPSSRAGLDVRVRIPIRRGTLVLARVLGQ